MTKANALFNKIPGSNTSIITCENINLYNSEKNFKIDKYMSRHDKNKEINTDDTMELSKIRPFGEWYNNMFDKDKDLCNCITYNSIISATKDIHKHPISYYTKFLDTLSTHHNPEVGHYIERSWEPIFHPMTNAEKIYY